MIPRIRSPLSVVLFLGLVCAARVAMAGNNAWTGNGPYGGYVPDMAIAPSDHQTIYATDYLQVYKSTDGGASWIRFCTGAGGITSINVLAVDPSSASTVYAGTSNPGGVLKTTDGGSTWSTASSGLPVSPTMALVVDPSNTQTIYAGAFSFPGGGVYKTTDGGANWSAVTTGLTNIFVSALAIHPTNTQTLYAGARRYPFPGPPSYGYSDGALAAAPVLRHGSGRGRTFYHSHPLPASRPVALQLPVQTWRLDQCGTGAEHRVDSTRCRTRCRFQLCRVRPLDG